MKIHQLQPEEVYTRNNQFYAVICVHLISKKFIYFQSAKTWFIRSKIFQGPLKPNLRKGKQQNILISKEWTERNVTLSLKVKGSRTKVQFHEQFTQEKRSPLPEPPKKYFQASMAQKNPSPANSIGLSINPMQTRIGIKAVIEIYSLNQIRNGFLCCFYA